MSRISTYGVNLILRLEDKNAFAMADLYKFCMLFQDKCEPAKISEGGIEFCFVRNETKSLRFTGPVSLRYPFLGNGKDSLDYWVEHEHVLCYKGEVMNLSLKSMGSSTSQFSAEEILQIVANFQKFGFVALSVPKPQELDYQHFQQ